MVTYGAKPAAEWFDVFQRSPFEGHYALGILNIVYMLGMLPVFVGRLVVHRHTHPVSAGVALLLSVLATGIYISSNAAVPMLELAQQHVKVNLQTTSNGKRPIAGAMAPFVVWTAVTWLLEGRIETFLRPEAVKDRLVYAIVANVAIGIVGAAAVVRRLAGLGLAREAAGFGPAFRTWGSVAAGAMIGFALYVIQGAPTLDPIILLNAFAQVFVVSVAEVLVCWAVVAATVENSLEGYGKILAGLAGA